MKGDTAPGPDGYNPAFFQKYWSVVGPAIFEAAVQWLQLGSFPPLLNNTNVVLLPKRDPPQSMQDLRPISLCNVVYKIVSKVLCNRLKTVLPHLINAAQSAFVPDRAIQDNILIGFEIIHMMKNKRRGRRGDVALKVDISKAYDRVHWHYLQCILTRLGFSEVWIGWMLQCVTTVQYSFHVNDDLVGPIVPLRGLRQGDPLSPYLFILCAEGLSAALKRATTAGLLHGVKVCRRAPQISHLMFADDCLLFCQATASECLNLKRVLDAYEFASGQAINYGKSGIFFSKNVGEELRGNLAAVLGVHNPLNTGRYLGLPSLIGRRKRHIFSYIKDRLFHKLQGWRTKCVSRAGKEVLIKTVAQALPTFCMSIFLLPSTLLEDMHRMLNAFWWGSSTDAAKGVRWLAWEKLCVRKEDGGRGFRDLRLWNTALLAKFGWRLIHDSNALVCRVFKARYFPHTHFLDAPVGHRPSLAWRSVHEAQSLLRCGVRWKIGSGESISVWGSPWVHRDNAFRILSPVVQGCEHLTVADLMNPMTRSWNRPLVDQLFMPADVEAIIQTPIAPTSSGDRLVWHFTQHGMYSVKSGYKLAYDLIYGVPPDSGEGWDAIWKLAIPPRVQDFLWRSCRDVLPHKTNLFVKGVVEDKWCTLCGNDFENPWHLFFNCHYALQCWNHAHLRDWIESKIVDADSFCGLVLGVLRERQDARAARFGVLMWKIWQQRNAKLWNRSAIDPQIAVAAAESLLREWNAVQGMETLDRVSTRCRAWHAPPLGSLKLNVDTGFFAETGQMGFGFVLRDDRGDLVVARTSVVEGCFPVAVGEALGFLEALSWLKNLGLDNVIVEGDGKVVIDAINGSSEGVSIFHDIIKSCRQLVAQFSRITVSFVYRAANSWAHLFARTALQFASPWIWVDPPEFVVGQPVALCSCSH